MDYFHACTFLFMLILSRGIMTEQQNPDSGLEIYKKLFEVKRKDQMNALKNLIELNDINQQYKIIDIMLKGLFKVLEDSRAILIAADVPPDGPFPQDEKLKDGGSSLPSESSFPCHHSISLKPVIIRKSFSSAPLPFGFFFSSTPVASVLVCHRFWYL